MTISRVQLDKTLELQLWREMEDKDLQWPELVLPSPEEVGRDFLQVRNQALKMEELVLVISSLPCCEVNSTLPQKPSLPVPV